MKRITIEVEVTEETASALTELAGCCNHCSTVSDGFASHGASFTPSRLLAMLAEDAAMLVTQPESWQSANMGRVFAAHGYQIVRSRLA